MGNYLKNYFLEEFMQQNNRTKPQIHILDEYNPITIE